MISKVELASSRRGHRTLSSAPGAPDVMGTSWVFSWPCQNTCPRGGVLAPPSDCGRGLESPFLAYSIGFWAFRKPFFKGRAARPTGQRYTVDGVTVLSLPDVGH